MWKFILQEFSNVVTTRRLFIVYSDTVFSKNALQTIINITNEYGSFDEIVYEQMKAVNDEQALNVCTKILSQCSAKNGLPEGCLVANIVDRYYQTTLFKFYRSIVRDTELYPMVSFYLDENTINGEWDNVYINIYIFVFILNINIV